MGQDIPPENMSEFFQWLRARTEESWAAVDMPTLGDFERRGVGGSAWQPYTRWLSGLTDPQIDAAETQWGLRFPNDYRLFLRMLHAPDRPMFNARFRGRTLVEGVAPSFFNWLTDADAIRDAMAWPVEGLVFDVFHADLWFEDWGTRPDDEESATRRLEVLTAAAPRLIPLCGHRYIVEATSPKGYVVLSVYQSDIIVYAPSLRGLLLTELGQVVGLGDRWGRVSLTQLGEDVSEMDYEAALRLPFWGRFLEMA
jgi:hypothetical protein